MKTHTVQAGFLGCALLLFGACKGNEYKKTEEQMQQPINCATAQADIEMLQKEKAHVGEQIEAGVEFILPVSAVVGMVKGTEGATGKVAIGEYNKAIDARIAAIKKECGIQ